MTLKDLSVGSPENMVQEVLDEHGFSMDDVLMVWASPPCEFMWFWVVGHPDFTIPLDFFSLGIPRL